MLCELLPYENRANAIVRIDGRNICDKKRLELEYILNFDNIIENPVILGCS